MSKKLLISFIIFLISGVLTWLLAWPIYRSFQTDFNNASLKQQQISSLTNILAKTKQYKELKENADKLLLSLPKELDVQDFLLVKLEEMSDTSALVLEEIKISYPNQQLQNQANPSASIFEEEITEETGPKESTMAIKTLPGGCGGVARVDLKVKGSYKDFKIFLEKLETKLRAVDVNSIFFNSFPQTSDLLNFSLVLSAYYR